MRISDWSSDVCSSELAPTGKPAVVRRRLTASKTQRTPANPARRRSAFFTADKLILQEAARGPCVPEHWPRSEEHTSELQSLMRNTYAVFCLKKKTPNQKASPASGKKHNYLRRKP